jgi:hypothetical protein
VGRSLELDFAVATKPTEVRGFAVVEVSRPQRHSTLVENDVGTVLRELRLGSSGRLLSPDQTFALSLTNLGLVDEYWLYFRPFVLGHGTPFFAGPGRRSALWPAIPNR